MIVVSKKNTKRLIKGERYEVVELKNSDTSRSRTRYVNGKYVPYIDTHGYLYIKDPNGPGHIGLSTSGFSDIDGKELPKIDWGTRPASSPIERYEFKDLKKGDILVCRSRRYKTLEQGTKYRIADLKTVSKNVPTYNGGTRTVTESSVKFEGLNRWFSWNTWSFRKLSTGEAREIHLSSLFGENDEKLSVDVSSRRIDKLEGAERDMALVKILASAINDRYRHKLGVVEWACQKTGSDYKVNEADFKHLLKMPLNKILKMFETN